MSKMMWIGKGPLGLRADFPMLFTIEALQLITPLAPESSAVSVARFRHVALSSRGPWPSNTSIPL